MVGHLNDVLVPGDGNLNEPIFKRSNIVKWENLRGFARARGGGGDGGC